MAISTTPGVSSAATTSRPQLPTVAPPPAPAAPPPSGAGTRSEAVAAADTLIAAPSPAPRIAETGNAAVDRFVSTLLGSDAAAAERALQLGDPDLLEHAAARQALSTVLGSGNEALVTRGLQLVHSLRMRSLTSRRPAPSDRAFDAAVLAAALPRVESSGLGGFHAASAASYAFERGSFPEGGTFASTMQMLRQRQRAAANPEMARRWGDVADDLFRRQSDGAGAAGRIAAYARSGDRSNARRLATALEDVNAETWETARGLLAADGRSLGGLLQELSRSDRTGYENLLRTLAGHPVEELNRACAEEVRRTMGVSGDRTFRDLAHILMNSSSPRDHERGYALFGEIGGSRVVDWVRSQRPAQPAQVARLNTLLGRVLDNPASDQAARDSAARLMLERSGGPGVLEPDARRSLVEWVAVRGSAEERATVRDRLLPPSPITASDLEGLQRSFGSLLANRLRNAQPGTAWESLRQLYAARALAEDGEIGRRVNVEEIDRRIAALTAGPLAADMAALQRRAMNDSLRLGADTGRHLANYIGGEDMQQRLRLMPEGERSAYIRGQLSLLAAIDPERMEEATAALGRQEILQRGLQLHAQASEERQLAGVSSVLDTVLGQGHGHSTAVAGRINNLLRGLDRGLSPQAQRSTLLARAAEALRQAEQAGDVRAAAQASGTLRALRELDRHGGLGSLSAATGVAALALGGVNFNDPDSVGRAAATGFTVASQAGDVARAIHWVNSGRWTGSVANLAHALHNVGRVTRYLGPVADAITAGLDTWDGIQRWRRGDVHGASSRFVGAAAGATSAVAGGLLLAGIVSGPVGWGILIGAGVVAGGAALYTWLMGETEKESFLRRGVQVDGQPLNLYLDRDR